MHIVEYDASPFSSSENMPMVRQVRAILHAAAFFTVLLSGHAFLAAEDSGTAGRPDYGFDYLRPSEYPGLPARIAAWLEARGLVIPQEAVVDAVEDFNEPHNAIQGDFMAPGSRDWAVYCADADSNAAIVVFCTSDTLEPMVVRQGIDLDQPEDIYLIYCCDEHIITVDIEYINVLNNYYKDIGLVKETPDILHHGIELRYGLTSEIYYYYNDRAPLKILFSTLRLKNHPMPAISVWILSKSA